MTINEYQKLAMTTLNKDLSKKDILINGVMGLCGESGEAIDLVKKWLAQGHELDEAGIIEQIIERVPETLPKSKRAKQIKELIKRNHDRNIDLEMIVNGNLEVIVSKDDFTNLNDGKDFIISNDADYATLEDKKRKKFKYFPSEFRFIRV